MGRLNNRGNTYVFNSTCIGASHGRSGKPCQDYSYSEKTDTYDLIIVSDGHGSDKYFRSDRGSEIAVAVTTQKIAEFVASFKINHKLSFYQFGTNPVLEARRNNDIANELEGILRRLCSSITSEWYESIANDWNSNPPTIEEMKNVPIENKQEFSHNTRLEKAYGCTLIAFVKTEEYWLALQIGDGKCIAFDENGNWSEPIPWDQDCFLNYTTSFCSENPVSRFRFCIGAIDNCPKAVFIGSDGMDDSYSPIEELKDFYTLLIRLMGKNTIESTEKEIIEFLPQLSERGSKDDMSLSIWLDRSYLNSLAINILKDLIAKKSKEIENLESDLKDLRNKEKNESKKLHELKSELEALFTEFKAIEKYKNVILAKKDDILDVDDQIEKDSLYPLSESDYSKSDDRFFSKLFDTIIAFFSNKKTSSQGDYIKSKQSVLKLKNRIGELETKISKLNEELSEAKNELKRLENKD